MMEGIRSRTAAIRITKREDTTAFPKCFMVTPAFLLILMKTSRKEKAAAAGAFRLQLSFLCTENSIAPLPVRFKRQFMLFVLF